MISSSISSWARYRLGVELARRLLPLPSMLEPTPGRPRLVNGVPLHPVRKIDPFTAMAADRSRVESAL